MRFNILNINFPILLLSLVMASVFWYMVVVRAQVDVQLNVQIEYKNIPKNLVITEGLINSIDVRLRGPEALLRDIPLNSRAHVVDLSKLHKGRNIVPFVYLREKNLRAFEVQDIEPSRMIIIADTLQERNVTIRPKISSPLNSAKLKIDDLKVSPSSVLISGPSSTISNINNIPLTVRISPNVEPGPQSQEEIVDISKANVTVKPNRVTVTYTVLSERKNIKLHKNIQIQVQNAANYEIDPQYIEIKVEVPEALEKNNKFLNGAQLSVTPPLLEIEESTLVPLRVTLPEGMTLLESLPKVITIKRLK